MCFKIKWLVFCYKNYVHTHFTENYLICPNLEEKEIINGFLGIQHNVFRMQKHHRDLSRKSPVIAILKCEKGDQRGRESKQT